MPESKPPGIFSRMPDSPLARSPHSVAICSGTFGAMGSHLRSPAAMLTPFFAPAAYDTAPTIATVTTATNSFSAFIVLSPLLNEVDGCIAALRRVVSISAGERRSAHDDAPHPSRLQQPGQPVAVISLQHQRLLLHRPTAPERPLERLEPRLELRRTQPELLHHRYLLASTPLALHAHHRARRPLALLGLGWRRHGLGLRGQLLTLAGEPRERVVERGRGRRGLGLLVSLSHRRAHRTLRIQKLPGQLAASR